MDRNGDRNRDRKPLTRRAVAQVLAGAAIVASAPAVIENRTSSATANALIEVFAHFREHVVGAFRASELEALAAAAHETAARHGIATLESAATAIFGRNLDEIGSLGSARKLRSIVAQSIRADYAADRVECVAGWILSRTELLIAAQTLRRPIGR